MCTIIAPISFKVDTDSGFGFIAKQPGTINEKKAVIRAMTYCPVGAIGDDGDEM